MISEVEKIVDLYVNKKFSSQQISEKLGCSASRINYILQKHKIPKRNISDAVYSVYETRFKKPVFNIKSKLNSDEEKLKVAGVMLYWGEGSKTGSDVGFANSDPAMIRLFMRFLREICGVAEERLRVTLHCYPDLNQLNLKKFWANITGLPLKQFHKVSVHEGKKGNYKNKSVYGTVQIRYSDKRLLNFIKSWIIEYQNI